MIHMEVEFTYHFVLWKNMVLSGATSFHSHDRKLGSDCRLLQEGTSAVGMFGPIGQKPWTVDVDVGASLGRCWMPSSSEHGSMTRGTDTGYCI